jgi:plastocyanin
MASILRSIALVLAAAATLGLRPGASFETGTLRGRVTVPDAATTTARPSVADLAGHAHGNDPVDRRRCIVYLAEAPRPAFEELRAGRARMDQRGEQFVPRILAITAGSTVDFPNSDRTFHNVFSLARSRTFDLGRYRPGRTGAVRFDKPGIVPVFCDIHSHMSAYILVFSHPYFAVTDELGRYQIANVPAGSHTLQVWSELGVASPRRVTVPEGGTVDMDFQVGRER